MNIILLLYGLLFGVAFYFINKLIDRWHADHSRLEYFMERESGMQFEINELFDKLNGLQHDIDLIRNDVDWDKNNIDACANSILNIRNDIGKLGNRLQKVEKEGKED